MSVLWPAQGKKESKKGDCDVLSVGTQLWMTFSLTLIFLVASSCAPRFRADQNVLDRKLEYVLKRILANFVAGIKLGRAGRDFKSAYFSGGKLWIVGVQ